MLCRDEDGYSALHRAAYEGCVEIAKFLIIKGANVNGKTLDGWTPLHSACNVGNTKQRFLFACVRTRAFVTIVFQWNQLESCKILLWNGADINAQSNGLQTPLHIAASECCLSKINSLYVLSNLIVLKN